MRTAMLAATSLALTLATPVRSNGQAAAPSDTLAIAPGTMIRAQLEGGRVHRGRVLALGRDTLFTEWAGGATAALLLREITRLEVSAGSYRPVLRNAGYGLAGAGMVGALAAAVAYEPCYGCFFAPANRTDAAKMGFLLGGTLGLVVGGLTGLVSQEEWRRLPLDARFARVALVMPPGPAPSPGIGIALAF